MQKRNTVGLLKGGKVGHKGGPGRPPDKLTEALVAVGRKGVLKVLAPLIDGKKVQVLTKDGILIMVDPDPVVRVRAVEVALRFGKGTPAQEINAHHDGRIELGWDELNRVSRGTP